MTLLLSKVASSAAAGVSTRAVNYTTLQEVVFAKNNSKVSNINNRTSSFSSNTQNSSDDDDHFFGVWQPNQTTVTFQRMEKKCPDVMKSYAKCVIDKQNSGALIQGACEEQFQAVMDCFRTVR